MSYTPAQELLQSGRVINIETRYQFATWKPDRVIIEINHDPFSSDSIVMVVSQIAVGSDMIATISGYSFDPDRGEPDYQDWQRVRVSTNAFRVLDV